MGSEKYFQQVASQWDQMRAAFFSEAVRDKALAAAGVRAGGVAADVGAGTGFLTEALLQAGLKVVAVDQSPEMLAQLQAKVGPGAAVD
jgi:ubiquinone/menaquinone biosynthesis C-methylase UbiE